MWIVASNRVARVQRATPEERAWLREFLSFPDPSARWRGKSPEEAVQHLYEEVSETFPSGFVPSVLKEAAAAGHRVELVDHRLAPVARDLEANLAWLKKHQAEALERCAERVRGIVQHTTAAGKAELLVGLTRAFPCHWLALAPDLGLVNNLAERFLLRNREHGIDLGEPGRIGDGRWSEGERLTCATYQSIYRGLESERCRKLLARSGGMFGDECHTIPAVTFLAATRACDAYWRIGASATPLQRGDMRSALAVASLGPVIHRYTAQQAVADGVVSQARVRMVTVRHPMPDGFTYPEVYQELVVNSAARNAVLTQIALRAEKPAILFVRIVDHGRELLRLLRAAGLRAEFVWQDKNTRQREAVLRDLAAGRLDAVVSSAVLKQGYDVPSIRSVVNGAGGESTIDVLQKLGRGSRIERGADGAVLKDEFTAYDVYDAGDEWLERHSKARRRAYLREGYEVVVEGEPPRAAAARRRIEWKPA